ncbi:M15 family metallopeptidase [Alkalihalobacillus pseudalcaliphilus]|uniref:M15 family metallopeptidase n=1 Tax=Alkalihalobacillus pseudalcaliphilus TaxID=79884 RepID=UPI00064DCF91|nr:M15 family metallopeptidase [Alkalihalobacillus pseudalcaliphilus]KMK77543.1 D-Ala-D-Ala carboxypeptidase [Alkalihalobacillus pseudalcaliphilus]
MIKVKLISIICFCVLLIACSNNEPEENQNEINEEHPPEENVHENEGEPDNPTGDGTEIEEQEPEDPSISRLVNKENHLESDYAPTDLVTLEVPTVLEDPEINQLREPAAKALTDMFTAALDNGLVLHARSGYRSYQTQDALFNRYVSQNGEEAANRFSARPGQSEHQTGLAIDITSESVNYLLKEEFGETAEGMWLADHAHTFGFILRFPEDKEDITGYLYEPWHFRYLGQELATDVFNSGLTYEEYLEQGES